MSSTNTFSMKATAPIQNIVDCITDTIGNTPLIRLNKLQAKYGFTGHILAKVEFFNPAGSIKDRPAKAMLQALMTSEHFSEKTEIIEASSGNNGVACAWLCAIYGIPLTIVIPEHMSVERQQLIRHYGGSVVTTPKEKGTKGAIDKAAEMVSQNAHAVSLGQFENLANPSAHANSTAQEIWQDTAGRVDVVIAGIGTGGTITGLASTLKRQKADIEVVAVEPASCPVVSEGRAGVHNIQGLSSGHIPDVLNIQALDKVITVTDEEAIANAKMLAKTEGIAVGISSGATLYAAMQLAALPQYADKNIVVILADGAERYFSTALFD